MGATFDTWLAKPSTIHFLRRLVAPYDPSFSPRAKLRHRYPAKPRSGRCSSTVALEDSEYRAVEGSLPITRRFLGLRKDRKASPTKLEYSEDAGLAFRMSVNAGVPLLDKDIRTQSTFGELRYQADVDSDQKFGKLLVDQQEYKASTKLWVELLNFRWRLDGFEGVKAIWQGMRRRDFDLSVVGEEADVLWQTFIFACVVVADEKTPSCYKQLRKLIDHALDLKARTGHHYPDLYRHIVGRHFRTKPTMAFKWHEMLKATSLAPPLDEAFTSVVVDSMLSLKRDRALAVFLMMYKRDKAYSRGEWKRIYDACIGQAIVRKVDEATVFYWHRALIDLGDEPSEEMRQTPFVQRLFDLGKDDTHPIMRFSDKLDEPKHAYPAGIKGMYPPTSRESMSMIVGDMHGIKPKEISDTFCARMFATRAFSVDLVAKGLAFFGVDKLGPLALREMAFRVSTPIEFSNRLNDLKTLGIGIQESVFSQILVTIAKGGHLMLFKRLLESDQHPESYEEFETQEALLSKFLEQHNWTNAHITLLALSAAGSEPSVRAWNRLLQFYLRQHQWRPMLSALQNMQSQGLPLLQETVEHLYLHALPERKLGRRRALSQGPMFYDPAHLVANAFMYASEKGQNVPSQFWVEVLKRYGMHHRWMDLEKMVLWLLDHYSPESSTRIMGLNNDSVLDGKRVERRRRKLEHIFTPNMWKALVVWGFRSASVRNQLRRLRTKFTIVEQEDMEVIHKTRVEEWAQGLTLLRRLQREGHPIPVMEIRRAFLLRMWILFGPGYSTLGINNQARRQNRLSLDHYIIHANKVWPGFVDWIDPASLRARRTDGQLLGRGLGLDKEALVAREAEYSR